MTDLATGAVFPPLRSLDASPNNLPLHLTSFVGREREIAAFTRLLGEARLLTLTGAGGAGKTRLALQVAAGVVEDYPDGVWVADLAPLADAALAPQTVATACGVPESPGRPILESLLEALRPRHTLLVLDNCEHLLEACAQLADRLLRRCPHVCILATSRASLGLAGETVRRVPSLSLPQQGQTEPLERVTAYEAVRLFVERARAVQEDFAVTTANALAVTQVCARLDGMPLAIELAAARVRVLSVEQVAGRLDDRFRLLTGGSRTALPRQQTLRALVDWSYDLLSAQEKAMLGRLSVFAGGWTLDAAEAVCAGGAIAADEVLDLLSHLVDKSLVSVEEMAAASGVPAEARYRLLETVRQYAAEKLEAAGEGAAVRTRHLAWCVALAERAAPELHGPRQGAWADRLETEHDNLRAALRWALAQEEAGTPSTPSGAGEPASAQSRPPAAPDDAALRLCVALWWFWYMRGYLGEGRRWLEAALARGDRGQASSLRARTLAAAGMLAHYQGNYGQAARLCEKSLALARRIGDKAAVAAALHGLAIVARVGGNLAAARAMHEEALPLLREVGDTWSVAYELQYLGTVLWAQGEGHAARAPLEQALLLCRQIEDQTGIGGSLQLLAYVAHSQGDDATARDLCAEALSIAREVGDRRAIARTLVGQGWAACGQGDYPAAGAAFAESLRLFSALGDTNFIAIVLDGCACVAAVQGQPVAAARLFGAASGLRDANGLAPRAPVGEADVEPGLAATRAQLDEAAFAAAWAEGTAMTLEQAIAATAHVQRRQPTETAPPAPAKAPVVPPRAPATTPAGGFPAGLTAREVEVLRLVAQGLTDAQVADTLVVSTRTINSHLSSIYSKLDVSSRTAATRFALDHHLV